MTQRRRPAHAVVTTVRIGLHHCDPLAVAWHGRYFEWFEMARTALFCSLDLDVPVIRSLGYRMYVVDARCRYMSPLVYGDTATIHAWFTAVSPLIRVAYDIYNPAQRWAARATTVLATTAADGTLLATTPDALLAKLPAR